MLTDIPKEFRKYSKHCNSLKHIIQDTQHSLDEIKSSLDVVSEYIANKLYIRFYISSFLYFAEDIKQEILHGVIDVIKPKLNRTPTIIVFGQTCHVKASFINQLFGQNILPMYSSRWRFVSTNVSEPLFIFYLNNAYLRISN